MTAKSVNTDAARYRALRREEVMVSMTHDGNTGSTPWLEGDELDKCADSLLAATPLEPIIEQAQPSGNAELGDILQGMFRKLDGVDHNQPGYHHASGWNAALRQVMDVLRAQTFSAQASLSDSLIEELAYEHCDETGAAGDCPKFIGTQSLKAFAIDLLGRCRPTSNPVAAREQPMGMVEQTKLHIKEIDALNQEIALLDEQIKGTVWRWQNDGRDHIESMGNNMGVLIRACDLRELIAAQAQPELKVGDRAVTVLPPRPTPLGVMVLKYFELLDRAMELDKSPTAWVHRPKGSPQARMAAWQEAWAARREIKEFINA